MGKTICTVFMDSLNAINAEGITTKSDLMSNKELYESFGIALSEFCHFALLSSTSKNSNGKTITGNRYKVESIESKSTDSREDVEQECAMKIIRILDYILGKPTVSSQYNCCFTIINNLTTDIVRSLSNKPVCFSIDEDTSTLDNSDKDYSWLDRFADNRYNPSTIYEERETLVELRKTLVEKRLERRKAIIHDTAMLSKRPAEAFVWLAVNYLDMKPRELANMIIKNGFYKTVSEIVDIITKENNIERISIIRFVSNPKTRLTSKSVKTYTQDKEIISEEISRVVYRARNHLK